MLYLFIILQCVFNIVNSRIDAYRILKDKTIAHGINFTAYGIVVGVELIFLKLWWPVAIVFAIQAFFNRQNTFDIPLNKRRGLASNYQTRYPKAIMDKIEYRVFGYNPDAIFYSYIILWAVSLTALIFLYLKF